MSTPAVINFAYKDGTPAASIYLHSDGYPEVALPMLHDFVAEIQIQTQDYRFNDPSYLAARFVVYASELNRLGAQPLDFLGVGIIPFGEDYCQDYEYTVVCDGTPPTIRQG